MNITAKNKPLTGLDHEKLKFFCCCLGNISDNELVKF